MSKKRTKLNKYEKEDFSGLLKEMKQETAKKKENNLIVTRHPVVAEFFEKELGVVAKVVPFARMHEVKGKNVYGHLPLPMAAEAKSVTVIHADVHEKDIHSDMTLEEYKNLVRDVRTYKVSFERIGDYYLEHAKKELHRHYENK